MNVGAAGEVPRPRMPGAELDALLRFFVDVTWSGEISAGGMGPGSPAMTGTGEGRHTRIHDGLWIVGDYWQDQFLLDGTHLLRWRLHWVTGWDEDAGEYRATLNDNYGHADVMRGHLDGDRLVYESFPHSPVRLRLGWDLSNPDHPVWTNEASVAGGPWLLVERYVMTPVAPTPPDP